MFRGQYENALDSKGRISIPSKFRGILREKYADRLVITKFDHCLIAFPYDEWVSMVEQKVGSVSLMRKEMSPFLRHFYASAMDCTVDKHGRLLIPQPLRDHANLQKEVVFVGEDRVIEIFAKERWLEEEKKIQEEGFGEIRTTLANLGV